MVRQSALFLHKPFDFLKACDNAFFSGRTLAGWFGGKVYTQFIQQF